MIRIEPSHGRHCNNQEMEKPHGKNPHGKNKDGNGILKEIYKIL